MDMSRNFVVIGSFLLLIASLCHSQATAPLTEPRLVAVTPLNSTALNVSWQFASSILDQSDLIRVTIDFYEFFFNYGLSNTSLNYVFTSTNKNLTSVVQNFQYVNVFYYVCFSSNSTNVNTTQFLYIRTCQLRRTCSRADPSICPQNGFIVVSPTAITSNSFTITVYWLNNLAYNRGITTVQLAGNGATGTALASSVNDTHTSLPYQFSGLQSQTSYTVNIIVSYTLFGGSLTDTTNYTLTTTSRSSNLVYTGNMWIFLAWSVLLSLLFS